ncbi:hypothetical protein [Oceanihabitans sediminis]|uniref:hypothetical protein n=1 Tax=Oceanihabitans sediminis TaxID=1812012 RepID=UPI00299D1541|nr:hypothetical protein [Oceanihabitans sediminis]MDX1772649.1 hypothetical protein [Oceanihabitans sediminis]
MTDENRNTYDNYLKLIDRAEFLKHKVYDHIITELSDLDFLEIQLGIYKALYIKAIKDHLPHFESIVNTDIEVNNYDKTEVEAILDQKQKAESLVNSIVYFFNENRPIINGTNKQFEQYYNSLNNKTAKPVEVANAKRPGNKTAERETADELIIKDWTPQTKKRFISVLKTEFSNNKYEKKDINNVISYLAINNYIDTSKANVVIKEAFCLALKNDKEFQAQTNFNNYYMKTNSDYANKFEKSARNVIRDKINNIIEINNIK